MRAPNRLLAAATLSLAASACSLVRGAEPPDPPSLSRPASAESTELDGGVGSASTPLEAAPVAEIKSRYGNPDRYEVRGRSYRVMASSAGYVERGIASWYGPGFHGRRTSSGETFDQNALSAAHRTLPLPTWVRVTNLDNGRSIVVRVNDRGPFHEERIIDLSRAAADSLGYRHRGTARVEVRALDPPARDRPGAPGGGGNPRLRR